MKGREHSNDRGAVFLLAVYMSALILLLLGGVSIQRTGAEMRAAQLSRDLHQSFWLADAAMDAALARINSQHVEDGIEYPVEPVRTGKGSASFHVWTQSATLHRPPSIYSGTDFWQVLVRQITATGVAADGRTTQVVSSFQESGPLSGGWAKRVIAAHGGFSRLQDERFFVGGLHAELAALATTVSNQRKMIFEGAGVGDPSKSIEDNVHALEQQVSQQLLGLKDGYKVFRGIPADAEDYAGQAFVAKETLYQEKVPHVEGAVSVGARITMKRAAPPFSIWCSPGSLLLPSDRTTVVDAGVPLVTSTGSPIFPAIQADGSLILCVKAIVPQDDDMWLSSVLGISTPELKFMKRTTLYLTGNETRTLAGKYLPIDTNNDGLADGQALLGIGDLSSLPPAWNLSLGAKLSTVDASGKVIPNGVSIISTDAGSNGQPAGTVWIQPGQLEGGVIYAPNALVVLRARKNGDESPLRFQAIAGDEVVIELDDPENANVGWQLSSLFPRLVVNTTIRSWLQAPQPALPSSECQGNSYAGICRQEPLQLTYQVTPP